MTEINAFSNSVVILRDYNLSNMLEKKFTDQDLDIFIGEKQEKDRIFRQNVAKYLENPKFTII